MRDTLVTQLSFADADEATAVCRSLFPAGLEEPGDVTIESSSLHRGNRDGEMELATGSTIGSLSPLESSGLRAGGMRAQLAAAWMAADAGLA